MKSQRHTRMLELVTKYEIETQDELMKRLQSEGFKVTQATVSRDLKELKLTKTLTARGTYRYSVNAGRQRTGSGRLNNAMVDSIVQVEYSMNNVVIKTYPGLAQAVASAVDALNMHNILGCVAGDDTVIIVLTTQDAAKNISEKLKHMMRSV